MLPQWSTTHSTVMHTDYTTTSKPNTNAQLLDFNATTWVINIPVHDMKSAFLKAPPQDKASTPWPVAQTKCNAHEPPPPPPMSPMMMPCLMPLNQLLSSALPMPPLMGPTHLKPPPPSSGTSLTLSEEDNVEALMTFSSSPTTGDPSHVSTKPQHSKNMHQKHKTFHSKPKSYTPLTKKSSPNAGMRSGCSSMEKQLSSITNTNGMVFNAYLKKNYGRNYQSSKDFHDLVISHSCGKLPGCTTPHPAHFSHTSMH